MTALPQAEWSEAHTALWAKYTARQPLVMARIAGEPLSSIVGLAFTKKGIWWVTDGCMDPMPSYHVYHFIEGELRWNRIKWRCGEFEITSPAVDHYEYSWWQALLALADGNVDPHRRRAEAMLEPWVHRPEVAA